MLIEKFSKPDADSSLNTGLISGSSLEKKSMETPEATVHSFIVKLWLEETGDDTKPAGCHGYITHVPSGARNYLRELADILTFIKPYLELTDADDGETPR